MFTATLCLIQMQSDGSELLSMSGLAHHKVTFLGRTPERGPDRLGIMCGRPPGTHSLTQELRSVSWTNSVAHTAQKDATHMLP